MTVTTGCSGAAATMVESRQKKAGDSGKANSPSTSSKKVIRKTAGGEDKLSTSTDSLDTSRVTDIQSPEDLEILKRRLDVSIGKNFKYTAI